MLGSVVSQVRFGVPIVQDECPPNSALCSLLCPAKQVKEVDAVLFLPQPLLKSVWIVGKAASLSNVRAEKELIASVRRSQCAQILDPIFGFRRTAVVLWTERRGY